MSDGDPDGDFEDDDLLAEDREEEEREECVQDMLELILERVNSHLDAAVFRRRHRSAFIGQCDGEFRLRGKTA